MSTSPVDLGPKPDPNVKGSLRTIGGCSTPPAHSGVLSLDELIHWPADQLAKLTCGDYERATPGKSATNLETFAGHLSSDQYNAFAGVVTPTKFSDPGNLVADFKAGVDQVGTSIGKALGLGGLLTGILTVVLTGVFVLGGLALVLMGLNRLTGGSAGRAATTAATAAAAA